jgi:hypothetical protein
MRTTQQLKQAHVLLQDIEAHEKLLAAYRETKLVNSRAYGRGFLLFGDVKKVGQAPYNPLILFCGRKLGGPG